jgi:hypothetical protein
MAPLMRRWLWIALVVMALGLSLGLGQGNLSVIPRYRPRLTIHRPDWPPPCPW